ncbi:pyridoxal phosphate-dependent aminotransferase [Halorussus lipolyticus]|uniref:pyridoxal phosphate-dependent aminotransferase n=1 Tax=Halorussus lipolyticus TaxID=3034024 RepID=UPI0023E7722B|nr:pyridoxal phosphate-dependent aminotransferase [Halorussus sp. DT80]
MFPDIAYLDWISGRPEEAEYDLGSSDLRRAPAEPNEVVPPALAGTPTPGATVEQLVADEYGVGPENVLVTAGATHANFLAEAAALSKAEDRADEDGEADDEESATHRVLVEKPGYEPLLATPEGLGATVDRFFRPPDEGYPLDPDRVDAALLEDTVLVSVSNRHNPSGRRTDREDLAEVARTVGDGGATLLVDEVYAPFGGELTLDLSSQRSSPVGPFGGPSAVDLPNTVVTNSLTKFFGFGDLRLGWLVADADFVARARSVKNHVPAVAEPSRRLARRVLADADSLVPESRERIRTNREALAEFADKRGDLLGRVEEGCTYAFLSHESADGDEVARSAWDEGVLVVPGRFFDDPESFRISACGTPSEVRAGLDRFGDVLDGLTE